MASMATLMTEARRLGIRVHLAHLAEPFMGIYDDEQSCVYIQIGLTMAEVKATLGHELGHAFHRHPCSTGRNERQADRRAAYLLITPEEYVHAELLDPHPAAIALELGLTAKVVRDYQEYWLPDELEQLRH